MHPRLHPTQGTASRRSTWQARPGERTNGSEPSGQSEVGPPMQLPLLLVSLLIPQIALSAPQAEPPTVETMKLFEVVRTWRGVELDHLGIGTSSLGDVNGDGVPDFILGKMTGAYTFYFGPGAARVVSGKDGSQLYEVRGTNKDGDCGDAYGDTIAPVGDLDGDGNLEVVVSNWGS